MFFKKLGLAVHRSTEAAQKQNRSRTEAGQKQNRSREPVRKRSRKVVKKRSRD
jgi:hypothetical protein